MLPLEWDTLEDRTLLTPTVFWTEDFEATMPIVGGVRTGTRTTNPNNGSDGADFAKDGDYFVRTNQPGFPQGTASQKTFSNILNASGNPAGTPFYWREEDAEDHPVNGSGQVHSIIWPNIDISGKTDLKFSGYFGATDNPSFERIKFIRVQAQIDTQPIQTILEFRSDHVSPAVIGNLAHDTNLSGTGDGNVLGLPLQQFGANPINGTGSMLTLTLSTRIGSSEEIAFDHFELTEEIADGPDIEVTGGGLEIVDADITPRTDDDTDFSFISNGASDAHTFTINNLGPGELTLSGGPTFVTLSGPDAGEFSVSQQPTSPLAANTGTTTFEITYQPTSDGIHSATVNIDSNDPDEGTYTFDLRGQAGSEIDVLGQGISITSGDTIPSIADGTNFGNANVNGGLVSHTFTINNAGADALDLAGSSPFVSFSGAHASDFIITSVPDQAIAANGGSTTFEISFNPSAAGTRTATVSITNDDPDESPYTFDIRGAGLGNVFWTEAFEASTPTSGGTRFTTPDNGPDGDEFIPGNYFIRTNEPGFPQPTASNVTFSNILDINGSPTGTPFYWRVEDSEDHPVDGSGQVHSITWPNINISGQTDLAFNGYFGATINSNKENNDFIRVEATIDSNPTENILEFRSDLSSTPLIGHFREDTNGDGFGDGPVVLDQTLKLFNSNSITGTGSLLTLKISILSASSEEAAFDHFYLDSTPLPGANLSVSASSGTEADETQITVTATTNLPVSGNQTLDVNVTGMGITAGDYQLSASQITIPDGQMSGDVTFTIQNDLLPEVTETATISISNPSSGIELDVFTSQDVQIIDNDATTPPTGVFLNELLIDPDGTDAPNEYVELRGPASQSLDDVFLIFVEGDSDSGAIGEINSNHIVDLDGTSIGSNGFLAIVDATGPSTHPYSIASGTTIVDVDGLDSDNASYTAFLVHHNGVGADPAAGQDLDTGDDGLDALPLGWTILDGIGVLDGPATDRAYSDLVFSATADGLSEGGATLVDTGFGADSIRHVMRIGNSTGSTSADWVAFDLGGTAPNYTVDQRTDSNYETGSLITDHLGAMNPTSSVATPNVNLSLSATSGTEAGTTTITATATASVAVSGNQTVQVDVSGTGITAGDFDQLMATITIMDGMTTGTANFVIQDDLLIEGMETATIEISNPSMGLVLGSTTSDTVDLTDNDTATVAYTTGSSSVAEDDAAHTLTVTLTTSPNNATLAVPVVVDIADDLSGSADGGGTDYTQTTTQVTFSIGDGDTDTEVVTITQASDNLVEGSEDVDLSLSVNSGPATTGTQTTHEVTITDSDAATVAFTNATSSVAEDDAPAHTLTVTLTTAPGVTLAVPVVVDINDVAGDLATGGGTDYTQTTAQVTFAMGDGNGDTEDVTITQESDTLVEGSEDVDLSLSVNSGPATTGAQTAHEVTITDDDAATVAFTNATSSVAEDDPAHTLTVTLSAPGLTLQRDLVLNITDAGTGSADGGGTDYTQTTTQVTFAANDGGGDTEMVTITQASDNLVEGSEDVDLSPRSTAAQAR